MPDARAQSFPAADHRPGEPGRTPCRARPSSTHARLRSATFELHRRIDRRLDLLAPALDLHRYRSILRTFFGYYSALEPRLAVAPGSPRGVPQGWRTEAIASDLLSLGDRPRSIEQIERCDLLPSLAGMPMLAGCTYVVEGSVLGGRVVARSLKERFGLTPERGARFFSGPEGQPGPRWQRVLAWIEQVAIASGDADEIVASARATFQSLLRWVELRDASV